MSFARTDHYGKPNFTIKAVLGLNSFSRRSLASSPLYVRCDKKDAACSTRGYVCPVIGENCRRGFALVIEFGLYPHFGKDHSIQLTG